MKKDGKRSCGCEYKGEAVIMCYRHRQMFEQMLEEDI
jgi:hypothetical protein